MVKVFPVPVCPNAKMQALYPSRTDLMTGSTSEKTSSENLQPPNSKSMTIWMSYWHNEKLVGHIFII